MHKRSVKILIVFLFVTSFLHAQVDKERIKASMLYHILDFVIWPDESKIENFTIGILGDNPTFNQELTLISQQRNIKNIPIVIEPIQSLKDLGSFQVLYVNEQYNKNIFLVFESIRDKNILLVTSELEQPFYSMINFFRDANNDNISFEVNKQNILLANLNYRDELIVYGGNVIDIKEMFRSTQEMLESEIQEVNRLREENVFKEKEIEEKNTMIAKLEARIDHGREILERLNDTTRIQEKRIQEQNFMMNNLSDRMHEQDSLLKQSTRQNKNITKKNYQLVWQISQSTKTLDSLKNSVAALDREIRAKELEIRDQSAILSEKDEVIEEKNKVMLLLVMLGFTLMVIGGLIFNAYKQKHKNNRILADTNKELKSSNEQLNSLNSRLEQQKNELENTLNMLSSTQHQLIQSEKLASLGTFTAGIAHEINNPINFISSGSSALFGILDEIKNNPEELSHKLEQYSTEIQLTRKAIEQGIDRTTAIVSSLRNYAHNGDDKFLRYNSIKCIQDALLLLKSSYKYSITLIEDYPAIIEMDCYPGKLNQLFVNLLNNAIQAIEDEGEIRISAKLDESREFVTFIIEDSGCGIDNDDLERVFDPFFTTKDVGKGTGLGLYIVHGIVEQHKGSINIHSEKSKGTRVELVMPVYAHDFS